MNKIVFAILIISVFCSCSFQTSMDATQGVVWETYLSAPPIEGIEVNNNNLYVGDSLANLYSIWMDTGKIRWERNLNYENITTLYPGSSGLYVVTSKPASSILRIFSYNDGTVLYQTNLNIGISEGYMADESGLILYASNKIAIVKTNDNSISIFDYSAYINNAASIVKGKNVYYIIDNNCNIIEVNASFSYSRMYSFPTGSFNKSAAFFNGSLFLSTSEGVKILNTITWSSNTSLVNWKIQYSPILFDSLDSTFYIASGTVQKQGFGKSDGTTGLAEEWFASTFSPISYSPMVLSENLSIAAGFDDNGIFYVFDKVKGSFINSKYLGIIDKPNLKIAEDYFGRAVFIPLTSPAKVVCYSLYYAMTQKK